MLTGADGRLATTEGIGQKPVEARACLQIVSTTGVDSRGLDSWNKATSYQSLATKVVRHQQVSFLPSIGFESRWGRHLIYNQQVVVFLLRALAVPPAPPGGELS